jgi:hypothetical protein
MSLKVAIHLALTSTFTARPTLTVSGLLVTTALAIGIFPHFHCGYNFVKQCHPLADGPEKLAAEATQKIISGY